MDFEGAKMNLEGWNSVKMDILQFGWLLAGRLPNLTTKGTCLFSNRYAKMAVNGAQMNLRRVKLAQNGYLAILVTPSWWVAKFNHQGDMFI